MQYFLAYEIMEVLDLDGFGKVTLGINRLINQSRY